MPPKELIDLLAGEHGVIVALVIALGWMTRQWYKANQSCSDERDSRDKEAKLAADAMNEQKLINRDAAHQIEMRDYRLQDTQQDLVECKQELLHYKSPRQAAN